jgi:phospholipid transport system transporter-binding protein
MSFALPASLTLANAAECERQLVAAIAAGERTVDAAALTQCDSSAVAVLISALRKSGSAIAVASPPSMLLSLATLYGADALLGLPAAPVSARHHTHSRH